MIFFIKLWERLCDMFKFFINWVKFCFKCFFCVFCLIIVICWFFCDFCSNWFSVILKWLFDLYVEILIMVVLIVSYFNIILMLVDFFMKWNFIVFGLVFVCLFLRLKVLKLKFNCWCIWVLLESSFLSFLWEVLF